MSASSRPTRPWRWMAIAATVFGLAAVTVPAWPVANGEPVPEGNYLFAVRLTMPDITRPDGTHYSSACSAALVAKQYIVSAGHCFHDGARNRVSGPVRYRVVATVGTTDLDSGAGVEIDVVEVWQVADRDLAVARLAQPAEAPAVPIRIQPKGMAVGALVRIAGWGWTGEGPVAPSPQLMTGRFRVATQTATTIGVVGHAPQPNTSACPYDSGAPYFSETPDGKHPRLVAIENTGPDCPHAQVETAARVDDIRGWILQIVGR